MTNPAPIVLFVYNRPEHTKKTLDALAANELAGESDLHVYSDGPKKGSADQVAEVRGIIRSASGFRSVRCVESAPNKGLVASIVSGVTEILSRHESVIVMEDDLVTSPCFLQFMNRSLQHYRDEPAVWHISGWNYPVEGFDDPSVFLWRVMNCWGWATWADRWSHFRRDPAALVSSWSSEKIHRFNLDGAEKNFWGQVERNHRGALSSWAVFWHATIFDNDGLCLNPGRSYVLNIGHDGSGQNCPESSLFSGELSTKLVEHYPEIVKEDARAVEIIKSDYRHRNRLLVRGLSFLRRKLG